MTKKIFSILLCLSFFASNLLALQLEDKLSPKSIFIDPQQIKMILEIERQIGQIDEIAAGLVATLPEEDSLIKNLKQAAFEIHKIKPENRTQEHKNQYNFILKVLGSRDDFRPYLVSDMSREVMKQIDKTGIFSDEIYKLDQIRFYELAKKIVTYQVVEQVKSGKITNQQVYFSVIETCLSRLLIKKVDIDLEKRGEKRKISYVIPMWNEEERLSKPSELFTGEDSFDVKMEQLEFLYDGIQNVDYQIIFMLDKKGVPARDKNVEGTRVMLQQKTENLSKNLQSKIIIKSTLDVDHAGVDLATSIKGGAVQVALRDLAKNHPEIDYAYYTDTDVSVNPGNTGMLLFESFYGEKDVVIGARTVQNSHVFGKSEFRKFLSLGFNSLTRALFILDISDTQVGAKLVKLRPHFVKIEQDFIEVSMSFDPQMLKLLQDDGASISEVGIVWIDSSYVSYSAGLTKRMFNDSMRMVGIKSYTRLPLFIAKQLITHPGVAFAIIKNFIPNYFRSIFSTQDLSLMPDMKLNLLKAIDTRA